MDLEMATPKASTDFNSPLLRASDDTVLEVSDAPNMGQEAMRHRKTLKRNQSGHARRRSEHSVDGHRGDASVNDRAMPDADRCEGVEHEDLPPPQVSGMHEAIQDAVTGAVQEAVQEHLEVVHEAMQEAFTEAVQAAVDEGMKFDVRANLYTLIAITGVVLYWRGIWTTWDYFFGFSLQSELGAVVTGLGIMVIFRILRVPLLDGLPSG